MKGSQHELLRGRSPDASVAICGFILVAAFCLASTVLGRKSPCATIYQFCKKAAWCCNQEDAPYSKQAAKAACQRRVALFGQVCAFSSTYLCFAVAVMAYNAFNNNARWMSLGQDICIFGGFFLALLGTAWPGAIRERSLDMWSATLMLLMVLFESPIATHTGAFRRSEVHSALVLFRAILSYICPTEIVGVSINAFALVSQFAHAVFPEQEADAVSRLSILNTLFAVTLETALLLALVALVRRNLAEEAQHAIAIKASQNELGAATALLHAMCDAVLELDSKRKIVAQVPRLADLLLHGPRFVLQGRHFASLLYSDEDRWRFKSNTGMPGDCPGPMADAAHYTMRDAIGNKVEVEVLHVGYRDVDESERYVVGIREHHDADHLGKFGPLAGHGSSSSLHDAIRSAHGDGFCVRACALSLEVLQCSGAFSRLFGVPPRRATVERLLTRNCRSQFRKSLGNALRAFCRSSDGRFSVDLGTLELYTLTADATSRPIYSAKGIVVLKRTDENQSSMIADLFLRDVCFSHRLGAQVVDRAFVPRDDVRSHNNSEHCTRGNRDLSAADTNEHVNIENVDIVMETKSADASEVSEEAISYGSSWVLRPAEQRSVTGDESCLTLNEVESVTPSTGGNEHEAEIIDDEMPSADDHDADPTIHQRSERRSLWV